MPPCPYTIDHAACRPGMAYLCTAKSAGSACALRVQILPACRAERLSGYIRLTQLTSVKARGTAGTQSRSGTSPDKGSGRRRRGLAGLACQQPPGSFLADLPLSSRDSTEFRPEFPRLPVAGAADLQTVFAGHPSAICGSHTSSSNREPEDVTGLRMRRGLAHRRGCCWLSQEAKCNSQDASLSITWLHRLHGTCDCSDCGSSPSR